MRLADHPLYAYAAGLVLVGAVLWPMFRSPPKDSFPLSTFPMFSHHRPAQMDIDHVVAVNTKRQPRVVPPGMVAGSEVLQTKVAIAHAVRRGRGASLKLCRDVAARLATSDDYADVVFVEVRRDRYDVLGYFSGEPKPLSSRVFARCVVRRTAGPARSTTRRNPRGAGT